jgi:phosphoadenosine phosphosulfate reductase
MSAPDGSSVRRNFSQQSLQESVPAWQLAAAELDGLKVLRWASEVFGNQVCFATSLGVEDQVITHMIAEIDPSIRVFTLDTGRLFAESYELIERTESRYGVKIDVFSPKTEEVEAMVAERGINLFYKSIENRKLCCSIRKLHPLTRALAGTDAWICGLRRDQGLTRQEVRVVEWDDQFGLVKINPLWNWPESEVWDYVRSNEVPYNPLHDRGFLSIGCACCTRPIAPGEDIRAGRWWWEQPEHKECGLHRKGAGSAGGQ